MCRWPHQHHQGHHARHHDSEAQKISSVGPEIRQAGPGHGAGPPPGTPRALTAEGPDWWRRARRSTVRCGCESAQHQPHQQRPAGDPQAEGEATWQRKGHQPQGQPRREPEAQGQEISSCWPCSCPRTGGPAPCAAPGEPPPAPDLPVPAPCPRWPRRPDRPGAPGTRWPRGGWADAVPEAPPHQRRVGYEEPETLEGLQATAVDLMGAAFLQEGLHRLQFLGSPHEDHQILAHQPGVRSGHDVLRLAEDAAHGHPGADSRDHLALGEALGLFADDAEGPGLQRLPEGAGSPAARRLRRPGPP